MDIKIESNNKKIIKRQTRNMSQEEQKVTRSINGSGEGTGSARNPRYDTNIDIRNSPGDDTLFKL